MIVQQSPRVLWAATSFAVNEAIFVYVEMDRMTDELVDKYRITSGKRIEADYISRYQIRSHWLASLTKLLLPLLDTSRGLWPFLGRLWVRNGRVSVSLSGWLSLKGHEFRCVKAFKSFILGLYPYTFIHNYQSEARNSARRYTPTDCNFDGMNWHDRLLTCNWNCYFL